MQHETKVVVGGKRYTFDWFCTCGDFGIGYGPEVSIFAESHERVANAHDERLEKTGQCIHGGLQHG
jgi:hypothetical protein